MREKKKREKREREREKKRERDQFRGVRSRATETSKLIERRKARKARKEDTFRDYRSFCRLVGMKRFFKGAASYRLDLEAPLPRLPRLAILSLLLALPHAFLPAFCTPDTHSGV